MKVFACKRNYRVLSPYQTARSSLHGTGQARRFDQLIPTDIMRCGGTGGRVQWALFTLPLFFNLGDPQRTHPLPGRGNHHLATMPPSTNARHGQTLMYRRLIPKLNNWEMCWLRSFDCPGLKMNTLWAWWEQAWDTGPRNWRWICK